MGIWKILCIIDLVMRSDFFVTKDLCHSFITVGPFPYALRNILKTWHLAHFGAKLLIFFPSNALVDDKNELACVQCYGNPQVKRLFLSRERKNKTKVFPRSSAISLRSHLLAKQGTIHCAWHQKKKITITSSIDVAPLLSDSCGTT